ncbi:hypothetical protein TNIN_249041 [Trichonephila inaurata madagascariensis]|uniref:Uncharacterized protein n=1 Tax=Trichonephila inaurata madagascariensis TaxID=2747483 RepID=A0A8X6XJG1_9ARAC|nr:hypothetical protein TNIN_249041 [Trichonephila inaurata madagascariensis]
MDNRRITLSIIAALVSKGGEETITNGMSKTVMHDVIGFTGYNNFFFLLESTLSKKTENSQLVVQPPGQVPTDHRCNLSVQDFQFRNHWSLKYF